MPSDTSLQLKHVHFESKLIFPVQGYLWDDPLMEKKHFSFIGSKNVEGDPLAKSQCRGKGGKEWIGLIEGLWLLCGQEMVQPYGQGRLHMLHPSSFLLQQASHRFSRKCFAFPCV